jgi:hypothetical protein
MSAVNDATPCYWSQARANVLDIIRADGLTVFGGKTLEAIRAEYPDAERLTLGEAIARKDAVYRREPVEITRERYWEMLEVLFPEDWQGFGTAEESFKLSERTAGTITAIFCRLGERHFELADCFTTPHAEIVARCRAVAS